MQRAEAAGRAGQGTTLGAYLVEQRLLREAELLRSGRSRIADIAFQVGFGDISYFCRAFRQRLQRIESFELLAPPERALNNLIRCHASIRMRARPARG